MPLLFIHSSFISQSPPTIKERSKFSTSSAEILGTGETRCRSFSNKSINEVFTLTTINRRKPQIMIV
jgi:hypothetical protein